MITNPGGLQARVDFPALFRRKTDIALSLGYSPLLHLYGYVFDSFDRDLYPGGLYGRLGIVPFKRLRGFIGAELTPQFTLMKTETSAYRVSGNMPALTLNGLCQYRFGNYTMAANLRLGGGVAVIGGIQYEHRDGAVSEEVAAAFFFGSIGASFEWTLRRGLFVEAGAEYVQGFSPHSPPPGLVRANVGAGWKF